MTPRTRARLNRMASHYNHMASLRNSPDKPFFVHAMVDDFPDPHLVFAVFNRVDTELYGEDRDRTVAERAAARYNRFPELATANDWS